ncbi:MAG: hypothetical protein E7Z70_05855 [Thermoplasmata archaeon]|nr:hypothetical protein [Thermoplasmata archaeon]
MLTWEDIIEAEVTTDRREFGRMCSGITVFRQGRAMILLMPNAGFRTLSSGFTNGGFMDSPQAVVNVSAMGGKVEYTCMKGGLGTYDRMNMAYAQKLGLDPQRTIFQGTAANMENAAIVNEVSANGVKVSLAVTGGIRRNGGRAGDPADYDESESMYEEKPGTIITLMALDANLSDGAMFQAMLIATEAKSCVIQELQARSLYSEGIATGSGTDQVTIISNTISSERIESIPRDSELARTISQCMKQALRKTFDLQTGMNPRSQWDPLVLMSRYSMDGIRDEIRFPATMDELLSALEAIRKDPYNTAVVSAVLNIADDVRNGLMSELDGIELARSVCEDLVLQPVTDPVERLRLDFAETIPDVLSYASALKLMEVVRERRSSNGQ